MCAFCERFEELDDDGPKCEAFPAGIPEEIYFDGEDHRRKFADEDLLFLPEDAFAEAQVVDGWGRKPSRRRIPEVNAQEVGT
jgi:hypothetical protein